VYGPGNHNQIGHNWPIRLNNPCSAPIVVVYSRFTTGSRILVVNLPLLLLAMHCSASCSQPFDCVAQIIASQSSRNSPNRHRQQLARLATLKATYRRTAAKSPHQSRRVEICRRLNCLELRAYFDLMHHTEIERKWTSNIGRIWRSLNPTDSQCRTTDLFK